MALIKTVIRDQTVDTLGIPVTLTYNDAGTVGRGSTIYIGQDVLITYAGEGGEIALIPGTDDVAF